MVGFSNADVLNISVNPNVISGSYSSINGGGSGSFFLQNNKYSRKIKLVLTRARVFDFWYLSLVK